MASPPEGMFRRFTRLVTTPARDLIGLPTRDTDIKPTEFDKAEMKAMIERKRRNDYVRKRELDMLRRIRREGLSADQAAAMTMQTSRIDEAESRTTQASVQSVGIKAKIDAIERQMVGATSGVSAGSGQRGPRPETPGPANPPPPILTTTVFDEDGDSGQATVPVALVDDGNGPASRAPATQIPPIGGLSLDIGADQPLPAYLPTQPAPDAHDARTGFAPTAPVVQPARSPGGTPPPVLTAALGSRTPATAPPAPVQAPPPAPRPQPVSLGHSSWVEVSEVTHDTGLDEPVIAFAGGDFSGCEAALLSLVASRGERRDHEDTWLVLFDLYRAIGQQSKFDSLTNDYVERFHRSGPQWFSLPQLLAQATAAPVAEPRPAGGIGWVCPAHLDIDAVHKLDALSMQLPAPWIMDWSGLDSLGGDAAEALRTLMQRWAGQTTAMRWVGGERLLHLLSELAPTGVRDADPVFWMLRLEALRLAHRPDQFDEVAIDYCVTYEVSPPSWEKARCTATFVGANLHTRALSLSVMGDAVTTFQDSLLTDDSTLPAMPVRVSSVELSGQLAGDQTELLARLSSQVGEAQVIQIQCALLMRVDFIAAGDLLNWVQSRRNEGREIVFQDAHRLVALMFGAMGISEMARVLVRN